MSIPVDPQSGYVRLFARATPHVGALSGVTVSVKDVFDVAGYAATGGSRVRAQDPLAVKDATVVARLKAAGAILTGHTAMTEFAYSGLGLNPHFEPLQNPLDPARIPGGSSSGAAVSVARGSAQAAVGTDTAGSVRIPAAFCGLVGFKPTQARVPRDGMLALAPSLDSVGPIAPSVALCATVDAVISGETSRTLPDVNLADVKLAIPDGWLTTDLDAHVQAVFARAVDALGVAKKTTFQAATIIADMDRHGAISPPEALAQLRPMLERGGHLVDPRVRARLLAAEAITPEDTREARRLRALAIDSFDAEMSGWDAVIAPTVAVVPPRFADFTDDATYVAINNRVLRNARVANLLDVGAITVPCHQPGELPVGLMLMGRRNDDARLLALAGAVEEALHLAWPLDTKPLQSVR